MKTDLAGLSEVYLAHLREKGPDSADSCVSSARIARCVLGKVSRKERAEVIGHAANCAACAAALKKLLAVSSEVDNFTARIEELSRPGREPASRSVKPFWARLGWRPAVVAAAGLFAVALLTYSLIRLVERPVTRGGTESPIQAVFPMKTVSPENGILFKWRSSVEADYYVVEVFDKAMKTVWRSGPVRGNELRGPAGTELRLTPGETYYWLVTGVTAARAELKSKLAEFSAGK
jgi:hypothetical protein